MVPEVASRWYEVGIKLLNEDEVPQLDIIKADHPNDKLKCCTEMFWHWLNFQPEANWQQLIDSLKSPGVQLNAVAAHVETMFTGK